MNQLSVCTVCQFNLRCDNTINVMVWCDNNFAHFANTANININFVSQRTMFFDGFSCIRIKSNLEFSNIDLSIISALKLNRLIGKSEPQVVW